MPRCPRLAPPRPRAARARRDDDGFTIVEVTVAIVMVTIVMTALAAFFLTSTKTTEIQGLRQTASQLATDSLDKARTLGGLDAGQTYARDKTNSDLLWAAGLDTSATTKFPGVAAYLGNVTEAYDSSTASTTNSALTAPLPICIPGGTANGGSPAATCVSSTATVTVNGIGYTRNWFIGNCWVLKTVASTTNTTPCAALAADPTTDTQKALYVQYRRVVVAVVWSAGGCANSLCIYISSTMTSAAKDPTFDAGLGATKPKISNPGAQTNDVGQTVALPVTESGGTAPFTWSVTGLPDGLSLVVAAGVASIGGRPTAAGTFSPVLKVVDGFGFVSSAAFTWTINLAPNFTNPGNQVSGRGSTVALPLVIVGNGTSPVTFTATGLPAGLSVNATTGAITGSPTTVSLLGVPSIVVVKMTDKLGVTDTETFTWLITPPIAITTPGPQTSYVGTADNLAVVASGGTGTYTWTASGLPAGLAIGATTGVVTGTPTTVGSYTVSVTVKDAGNATATATTSNFSWTVSSGLVITNPASTSRSNVLNSLTAGFTATATGGTAPYTWVASGLPYGMGITNDGVVSGSPSRGGRYLTMLTVTDSKGKTASVTFVWTISGGVQITGTPAGDRTDNTGNGISADNFDATGGPYNNYYWTASGLPDGLDINPNSGVVNGKPTKPGVYTVTITAYNYFGLAVGAIGQYMFVWTVTS